MLFHSLFAPEVGLYFVQKSCTLFGELNLDAFERAWQKIIDRHPVLRTAFVWEELDEPVQVVYRRVRLPLQQQDWRDLSSEEQQARLAEHLKAERRQGFDLTQAPLMRLHLIRLTDDSYRFTWSHHHLLLDGWCNTLILKEVFTFYEAFSQGREIELPESRPFRDYIGWLQGRDLSQAEKFWRSTLKGFTTPTPLKVDSLKRTRDAEQSFSEEHTLLSLEATQALQAIARKHRLTMHTIVQGAWALLLRRYSGQSDVLFGDVVAGRPAEIAGIETMMGMFINALPVRVEVTPTERLLPWLLRLQEQQIESRQYEYSPLVQVQKWSDAPTGATLFETLLGYQNYPVDASLRDGRSSVRIDEVSTIQTANNPIIVTFTPVPELMTLIKYDCSRFEVGTIRRMLDHLTTVLEAMAANPNRCLAEYEVLTAEERQQLLVEWNETATSYPAERQVQELFEEQAGRTPEAVALVFDGRSMTYSELNERANQLAHHLRSLGVGAESLVGLCLGRSVELIVGMLGILKAGGAYVPLDPSYPVERLSFMMEDSGVEALVAEERLLDELPSFWGPVVCLDSDSDMLDLCETENLPAAGTSAGLAYVIYTSGSTGTPKGISIVHSAITRLVCNTDYITLTPQDRVAQASNSSFDAATFEVWGALLNGARLVGISKEVAISPVEMAEQIREQQISTLFLTTALFNQLADSAPGCFSGVRHLLFGGEAVDVRRVRQVMRDGGPKRLLHVYGPTESTTFATWQLVEKVEESDTTVTIGKPLANTLCYVLDDRMQPVPVGVDGELYIGGDGLARCYLKRPETTAERFVPHPFSQEAGARLYRTGDRVRYTTQGEIEFLGRVDNQVKVRGHRIELGEIEAMLSAHHAVREATVIVRDDSGDRRLVAYVVPAQEQPPATEDLRHYLGEKLPSYMMPSRFLFLEALPLTPNGKVDRRALPAPDATREDLVDTYLAPQTPTEEMLANIWSDVLAVEQISICDNFFELGGHSLLATQVMSRLREAFSVEIPFRELFDQPTLRELAQRVDEARRVSVLASAPPLEKVEHEGGVALSFAQQRLWFLDQLEPGNSNYNIPIVLRLKGALDVAALKSSINGILLRHETLRTSFSVLNNEPIQVIAPFSALTMPLIDLSALPAEQAQMEAIALRDAEARHSFNLAEGPLLTVKLLRLADDEHLLLLTMHHIIADGWSMGILVREVAALYEAHRNGIEAELPELPIQYADYAVWQRQYLSGEVLEQQLSYWTKQLAGAPAVLELPTDRPRPAVQSFRGSALSFSCSPQVSQALRAFSKREGVTLYMTLLAAFAVLLQRYSGENEIVIGTPIANRNRMEVEGLIGFFVNSLAMHVKVGADPTFGQLVESVREVVLGAYAHQDVPFERIVEELKPERDLSRAPIFQVMFAWQNAPAEELGLEGVRISYEGVRTETTKYDMGLTMWERDGGGEIEGLLDYSTDLYDEARMRGLSEHFTTLLENIVANPEGQLSSLTRLPEAERRQQLVEWNATQTEYPSELCIHQLFEAQTARTPDACAVICQGQQLTYRELNERANRLAHYLRKLGVKAESIVGLCMEQSTEMMVAMLGILKAGGAYLPLDPSYPVERLNFLLEDARVGILLTRKSLAEKFGTRTEQVICLDTLAQTIEQESEENVACHLTAGNLAYVIYTSGSTGMPKGVLVQHRGLVNHSTAVAARYGLQAGDRVLQFASTSFDVAAEEIYPTWLSGGTVVLWPERHQVSFIEFERFVESQELSVLNLPTPYWQEWVQALISRNGELPAPLRLMIVGSAQGLPERFASWQKIAGERVRSFNAYGPTEATITSTVHELNCLPEGCELQSVLIGRPIANTQAYLLDEQLRPVPTGVAGELFLGGAGLARGYLNQSALTAERFIPNPFSQEAGARLYRTGDRVRYTTQGEIEFLGRVDNQVKVRGHRIELGEIEAVLAQHDAVRDVVVVASDSISQEKFLAAYVVAMPEPPPTAELRAHLRARLPEYMVPASFLFLEALPLTPNGKVDRRALPAPDSALPSPLTHLAPRTATEELLSGIWSEVLKLEGFGIRDNFFDLGGHSLLATQAISRVREVFGIEVALRQLFEGPTVEALAEAIEAARRGGADVGQRLRIERTTRKVGTGIALSFAQQRLWFIDQLEPGSGFYNIPVALRLQGELDVAALERSFNELIGRHEPLRTRFATVAGEPVQVISDEWQVRLDVEDISGLSEVERAAEVERRAEAEAREGFDLAEGPLLRVKLLRLADDEHLLLLTMHHIIADGWSMGILVREVAALYEAHRNGIEAELPELPIQYADYAVWQREYLSGEVLEQQLSYWTKQLAGAPAVLELPTDRPRPEEQTYRGAQQEVKLSASVSEQLRALSRREGVTLYMTLLAAFDLLLYHYTRNEDVVVGTDVANRNLFEVEGLIGFFVNQLAMRVNLSGDPTFRELLQRVRKVSLEAYAHQEIPFDRLVDALKQERSLKYSPLFQVKLILQNTPMSELEIPGLTLSPVEINRGTSQLDLNLRLTEFDEAILGSLEYSTDLFDHSTMTRMLRRFETLLDELLKQPDARLSELLAALAEQEQQQKYVQERELKQSISHKLRNRRRTLSASQESKDAGEETSTEEVPALIG
jgi:amino acid adenylation domain-containing protein